MTGFEAASAYVVMMLFMVFWFFVFLAVYFLPTGLAAAVRRDNLLPVFLVNFFFGWSVVGWMAALIMAFWPERRAGRVG